MKGRRKRENLQAMLLGALIGVSLIADTLVREGVVERERLVEALAQAEALAKDGRFYSLSALRRLIERGFRIRGRQRK